jgi:hypothetical protein
MEQIKVFIDPTNRIWCAEFVDNKYIFELFSTHILPLPFTQLADENDVIADVQSRHPLANVSLKEV